MARIGESRQSKALAEEIEKSEATRTILNVYWLPVIRAANDLRSNDPSQTFVDLEPTVPYELTPDGNLYPAYIRGEAYLRVHNPTAAAAEFQKIVDHKDIVTNFVTGALAHLQIGRAYAMSGDIAKAKGAYEEFLALWKNADPDVPILTQAKAEYEKLQ